MDERQGEIGQAGGVSADPVLVLERTLCALDGMKAHWRRAAGINFHERAVLCQLLVHGARSEASLAELVALSPAALRPLMTSLEADGYVARVCGSWRATRQAELVLWAVARDWITSVRELADELGPDKWAVVAEFLRGLEREAGTQTLAMLATPHEQLQAAVRTELETARGAAHAERRG